MATMMSPATGTMSDSGEEDAGASEKKGIMYKIKALKRRTVHTAKKAIGKAESTQDPEFDELYERFDEVRLCEPVVCKVSVPLHSGYSATWRQDCVCSYPIPMSSAPVFNPNLGLNLFVQC